MSRPAPVVIVVEDDAQIRRFVVTALESEGYAAFEADGAKRALIEAGTRKPDLLVLDLGLPDGNGIEVIRELRAWSDIPVIVLSARSAETDKIDALDAGADDYLTKPFGAGELLARVRAQLRRHAHRSDASSVVSFGAVTVDLANRRATRDGEALHLTPIEYRLLMHLLANSGKVLTQRQLLRDVWGPGHSEDSHYLRVYMGHLRRKIEIDPARPKHIVTETGVGYRFVM